MLQSVYKFLWTLLHLLLTTYETLHWLCLRIHAIILWSYDLGRSSLTIEQQESSFLKQCKQHLTKLPHHLSLIVGPDSTDFNEDALVRIMKYAFIMDISYISFYDTRRLLNESPTNSDISIEHIAKANAFSVKELSERHFRLFLNSKPTTNGKIIKNGFANGHVASSTNKSLEIFELLSSDNRSHITRVCRSLFDRKPCSSSNNNNTSSPSTSEAPSSQQCSRHRSHITDHIKAELSGDFGEMPDPELAIIFSPHACTFGTLPWQTRFTEFHTFEPGLAVNAKSFVRLLYRYSRCEQRWGK